MKVITHQNFSATMQYYQCDIFFNLNTSLPRNDVNLKFFDSSMCFLFIIVKDKLSNDSTFHFLERIRSIEHE